MPGDHLPVGPGDGEPGVHAHRPGLGDGPGDRVRVDHAAGDVAEEEERACIPPHDADEANLLADVAVVA